MKRKMVRVFKVCFLFLVILGLIETLATVQVAALDASGTWTSRIADEGIVTELYWADYHYDVTLKLNPTESGVSGTLQRTVSSMDINVVGWEGACFVSSFQ